MIPLPSTFRRRGIVEHSGPAYRNAISAFEWLQECYVRQVIVEFSSGTLTLRKPRGAILRKMIFPENAQVGWPRHRFVAAQDSEVQKKRPRFQIIVYHSEPNASTVHGPYCLIKLRKTYDLVIPRKFLYSCAALCTLESPFRFFAFPRTNTCQSSWLR